MHSLDSVGLAPGGADTLRTRQLRILSKSPSLLTHETGAALFLRLKVTDPVVALQASVNSRLQKCRTSPKAELQPKLVHQWWRQLEDCLKHAQEDSMLAQHHSSLRVPTRLVTLARPVDPKPCLVCGCDFPDSRTLRIHVAQKHPDQNPQRARPKRTQAAMRRDFMQHLDDCPEAPVPVVEDPATDTAPTVNFPSGPSEPKNHGFGAFPEKTARQEGEIPNPSSFLGRFSLAESRAGKLAAPTCQVLADNFSEHPCLRFFRYVSQATVQAAVSARWHDVATAVRETDMHHCLICNQWLAHVGYLSRHIKAQHPEIHAHHLAVQQWLQQKPTSVLSPCQFCGLDYKARHCSRPRHVQSCPVLYRTGLLVVCAQQHHHKVCIGDPGCRDAPRDGRCTIAGGADAVDEEHDGGDPGSAESGIGPAPCANRPEQRSAAPRESGLGPKHGTAVSSLLAGRRVEPGGGNGCIPEGQASSSGRDGAGGAERPASPGCPTSRDGGRGTAVGQRIWPAKGGARESGGGFEWQRDHNSRSQPRRRGQPWGTRRTDQDDTGNNRAQDQRRKEVLNLCSALTNLVLRHEDQMSINRSHSNYIMFCQTQGMLTVIPEFVKAMEIWKDAREKHPGTITLPLRNFLLKHWLELLRTRFQTCLATEDARTQAMEMLILSPTGAVPYLEWDPAAKAMKIDRPGAHHPGPSDRPCSAAGGHGSHAAQCDALPRDAQTGHEALGGYRPDDVGVGHPHAGGSPAVGRLRSTEPQRHHSRGGDLPSRGQDGALGTGQHRAAALRRAVRTLRLHNDSNHCYSNAAILSVGSGLQPQVLTWTMKSSGPDCRSCCDGFAFSQMLLHFGAT